MLLLAILTIVAVFGLIAVFDWLSGGPPRFRP